MSAPPKPTAKQDAPKKVQASKASEKSEQAETYRVYDTPLKPRHLSLESIRKAVKG